MGQFSWLDCETRNQILVDVHRNVYVLVPKEYGRESIIEKCYEGYGIFGGTDIFDLVADWNRHMIPRMFESKTRWKESSLVSKEDLMAFYNGKPIECEKRLIGIWMACYDADNAALDYPIKITHNKYAVYEDCHPSWSDPNQGWK